MNERKLVRVPLTFPFLFDIIKQGYEINSIKCTKGLPSDTVFVSSHVDENTQTAYLIFAHDSFEVVKPGYAIPDFYIEHERSSKDSMTSEITNQRR